MNILSEIIRLIYPDRCPYCNDIIKKKQIACKKCIKNFPKFTITRYCAGKYICHSAFAYKDQFSVAVRQLKFNKCKQYAEKLAYPLAKTVKEKYSDIKFDYITCVPMHKKKLGKRGYNQAEVLAKNLSKILHIPYKNLLVKMVNNKEQHKCTFEERYINVKGVYKTIDNKIIKDKSILIVDDIVTTGNTLGECCKILCNNGGKSVYCVTLCASVNSKK